MSRNPQIAARFWAAASVLDSGQPNLFPRRMETSIPSALPATIIPLSRLTISDVRSWLSRHRIALTVTAADRQLRGCLVAYRGHALIFVDEDDPFDELQLTLAHEAAHLLCHYLIPREQAIARLGAGIVDVLDGQRMARPEERLAGVLSGCPIGQYQHLAGRTTDAIQADLQEAEAEADLLAFELLAPMAAVLVACRQDGVPMRSPDVASILERDFGVPAWAAAHHAERIVRQYGSRTPNWLQGLRTVVGRKSDNDGE